MKVLGKMEHAIFTYRDKDVLANMPMTFKVTITLQDRMHLNRTELTLSEKEEFVCSSFVCSLT